MNEYPEKVRDVVRVAAGAVLTIVGVLLVMAAGGRINSGILLGLPAAGFGIFWFTYGMSGIAARREEKDDELQQ